MGVDASSSVPSFRTPEIFKSPVLIVVAMTSPSKSATNTPGSPEKAPFNFVATGIMVNFFSFSSYPINPVFVFVS